MRRLFSLVAVAASRTEEAPATYARRIAMGVFVSVDDVRDDEQDCVYNATSRTEPLYTSAPASARRVMPGYCS